MYFPPACPFCGGTASRRRPLLDRVGLGGIVAGAGLSLKARSWESYLHCHGCTFDYVRADRDAGTIAAGLLVEDRVRSQINRYHGEGVTVSDLLLRHCTGMARRVRPRRSIAAVSVDNSELFACFLHGGVRTFGSLVRRSGGEEGDHYVLRGLGKA